MPIVRPVFQRLAAVPFEPLIISGVFIIDCRIIPGGRIGVEPCAGIARVAERSGQLIVFRRLVADGTCIGGGFGLNNSYSLRVAIRIRTIIMTDVDDIIMMSVRRA